MRHQTSISRSRLMRLFLILGAVVSLWRAMGKPVLSRGASVEMGRMRGVLRDDGALSSTTELSHTVFLPFLVRNYYPPPAPSVFGVQMYGTITEDAQALHLANAAGVHWVRWPLAWSSIEPVDVTPDAFRWAAADRDIVNLTTSGQRVIATIVSAPSWAATYPQGPVNDAALPSFAEFVGELAERYDGDGYRDAPGSPIVDHFEFFNEPDSTNLDAAEQGYGSYYGMFGAQYAAMLQAVRSTIKLSNVSARIVLGGIAYDSFTTEGGSFNPAFLDDVLAAGGGAHIDVMNFHYYPAFESKWYTYGNGLQGKAVYLRSKLAQYGYGDLPMMVTEAGWHSDHHSDAYPGSPEIQCRYVVQLFAQAAAAHLDSMIWWTWIDPSFPYGANGLLTADRIPKLSFTAYRAAVDRIGQSQFDRILQTPPGIEGYSFTAESGLPIYVFWANDGLSHALQVPGSQARVTDMYGDVVGWVVDAADGLVDARLTITFGHNPIYVETWP